MIKTFADTETEHFYTTGKSGPLPPDIRKRAAMRLNQLDAATVLDDLRMPPSNHLELLRGDKTGRYSIRTINGDCVFNSKTAMLMP